ncbi:AfsR/SARP family transcriptional regulator [Flindersiella endophytica]
MPETQKGIQLNVGGILGYGGYLAAAITGLLTFRRKRHHVRRMPSQRLASPASPTTGTERVMRATQDPAGIDRVNHVLRLIAKDLTGRQRIIPALTAVRLTDEHIELHLAAETDQPPAPACEFSSQLWTVPNDAELPEVDPGEISSPYPALVTLGRDQHGNHVLVDLETAGAVNLLGPQDRAIEVLSAMAIEMAASPWADDLAVTVVGFGDDLPDALPGTVRHVQQLDDALDELAPKAAERQRLIASAEAPDVRTARTNDVDADAWTPEILLCAEPPNEDQTAQLAECVLAEPRLAITAVVTVADANHAIDDGWHLDLNEPYVSTLELPWPIRLQVLTQLEYTEITAALRTAGQPTPDAEPGPVSLPVQVGPMDKDETHIEPQPEAPIIRVLGPVEIEGAKGSREEGKEGQLTALACYLALHPGTTSHAIQEALWPGRRTTSGTRTTALSKLRRRLGTDADGNAFLPVKADGYRLADSVGLDWDLFLQLARRGMADQTADGTAYLERALQLIRGRPFEGVNYTHYSWIDPHLTEMTAAIVDVAHELAQRHLARQDFTAARTAIAKGRLADPGNQALWIDLLRTEAAAGNPDALRAAADRYLAQCADLDIDPEPEVTQLLGRSAASESGERLRP